MRLHLLRRYRQIAGVLARHGLGAVAAGIGLPRPGGPAAEPADLDRDPRRLGLRLRRALEDLGPTFVKLGQVLSTRADLLPPGIIRELSRLQDQVAPFPFAEAEAEIQRELGRPIQEVFAHLDPEPLAAASIGQVHAARLLDGSEVVVKVQRPGARALIEADLEVLRGLAELAERRGPWAGLYPFRELADEVARTLLAELDYEREAENAERLGDLLSGHRYLRVPRVAVEWCSPRLLVLERLHGTKLSQVLDEPGGAVDRRAVARQVAAGTLEQILIHGFFHADPHPGNLLLLPDGRIGLLDFGIVGALSEADLARLRRVVLALVRRDGEAAAAAVMSLVQVSPDTDVQALRRDLDEARRRVVRRSLRHVDVAEVVGIGFDILRRHRVRVPPDLSLVGKTLITLEGVVSRLDPDASVIELAEPVARELIRLQLRPGEVLRQFREWTDLYGAPLAELPGLLRDLSAAVRSGRPLLRVSLDHDDRPHRDLSRLANRLAFSILLLALSILLGSVMLAQALSGRADPNLGSLLVHAGAVVVAGAVLLLLGAIYRSGRL
ncbi:MAG: AarF/ABC1/UbiB kinase family protein [Thermaerobacter sp.]|nr:ABC transporter [Bacillota bacterium]